MRELPAGLADPLHILGPFPFWVIPLAALALILAILWFVWRKLRRKGVRRPPPTPRKAITERPARGIEATIDRIRTAYRLADRRKGCHQLSRALREHLETGGGHRFSTLTVGEIAGAIGDVAVARLFQLLSELQFGRHEPSGDDFAGICELAVETVARRGDKE